MPDAGPLGDTLFEARLRAMTEALFVKRSLGGWVASVVTSRTHRFFEEGCFFATEFVFDRE